MAPKRALSADEKEARIKRRAEQNNKPKRSRQGNGCEGDNCVPHRSSIRSGHKVPGQRETENPRRDGCRDAGEESHRRAVQGVQVRRAVGAPRPDWQELSEELMRKAVVYVDSSDWARTESGDIVLSGGAAVYAGLHRVRPSTGHQGDHQLPEQQVAPAEHPGRCAPLPCRHRSPQVMDAIEITAYRTAAASAVATKYLATEGPKILAVLGSGTQARSHVRIMTTMFRFEQVRIWNHRESSAASLVQELAAHGISARYEASAEDAVRDADVVVTATSSPKPVLQAGWLKKGAHVNAVGAPRPDWQELSEELMRQAVVYVDSTEGARAESGDVIISGADIFAEIGEVVLGAKENRRSDTTVFKSLGMAMEDVLAADLVYRHLSNDKS
ncbi:ketimine reductase mu-crystallin isoform X3 [Dermacentor variabilis]|uniref:ketimine reductase mu-crystallin isoform X3 n=1 Tax=Dermacentor variabilis TaxID=34621 RepID=UPI003F5B4244